MKLSLYTVQKEYFEYLGEIEPKVPFLKEKRPFLGTLLEVKNKNYFVPLSSPKEKHKKMKEQEDLIKIKEGELGVININNMIPIPISQCQKIQLEQIEDRKYRNLLKHQLQWCNLHQNEIRRKAILLYQVICYFPQESQSLKKRCCDFKKLEKRCIQYMNQNQLQEEELIYKIS